MTVEVSSASDRDTRAYGRRLAGLLRPGDIVVLCGRLGSGKTAFVGGIGDGLGVQEPVVSPSFILVRRYDDGFTPLIHADVYRLQTSGEFEDLDLLESSEDAILVIEWGDAVLGQLPEDHLRIDIEVQGPTERRLVFHGSGTWEERPLEELSV